MDRLDELTQRAASAADSGWTERTFRFGRFTAELHTERLLRDDQPLAVEPKAFRVLLYLLEHRDRLVTRDELLDQVWEGAFVTANALSRAVARLRQNLGDDARAPRFIETVPTRGFRFIADVRVEDGPVAASRVAESRIGNGRADEGRVDESRDEKRWDEAGPSWVTRSRVLALALALVTALGLALTATWFRSDPSRDGAAASRPSGDPAANQEPIEGLSGVRRLAVLPLANLGAPGDDDYLADGLTEHLIASLARVDSLRVIARTSALAYKDSGKRVAVIGQELGVEQLLEGSVRRLDEELRISLRLVDTEREEPIWSRDYVGDLRDVFGFERDVVASVAEALSFSISRQELDDIGRSPTRQITAFDLYLQGRRHYRQRTRIGVESAIESYEHALELDADFALAEAGLANALAMRGLRWGGGDVALDLAERSSRRALALDPDLAAAHKALAMIFFGHGKLEASLIANERALALDPDFDEALYNAASDAYELGRLDDAVRYQLRYTDHADGRAALANYLLELGFAEEAARLIEEVRQVAPLQSYLMANLTQRSLIRGELVEAKQRAERLRTAYPDWPRVWLFSAEVALWSGATAEAERLLERAIDVSSEDLYPQAVLRLAQTRWTTDRADAERLLARVREHAAAIVEKGTEYWSWPWILAVDAALREQPAEVARWLEHARSLGRVRYQWDRQELAFQPYLDEPAVRQVIDRMESQITAMHTAVAPEVEAWFSRRRR